MRILIVDDEVIIRTGLCTVIDWKELGLELLPPASSAEEALARIPAEKPHILLTDIRMSGKDGIELAREVKKLLPDTEIVILTGYDDFAYAQQALREGVTDYLLKTSRPEEIIKAAMKAKQRILEKWEALKQENFQTAALRNQLLERLVTQGLGQEPSSVQEQLKLWFAQNGVQPDAAAMSPMSVLMVSASGWGDEPLARLLLGAAENMLFELLPAVTLLKHDRLLLVVRGPEGMSDDGALKQALQRVEQTLKCAVFAALGRAVDSYDGLKLSCGEAEYVFSFRGLVAARGLFAMDDVKDRQGGRTVCSQKEEAELSAILMSNHPPELRHWVNQKVRARMEEPSATAASVQAYLQSIVWSGHRWLDRVREGAADAGIAGNAKLREQTAPGEAHTMTFELADQPEEEVFRQLNSIMSSFHDAMADNRFPYIQKSIAYIQANLDQHLSLQQVAKFVHLNPNHFSEVFKRETGLNYIEFVTQERMRRAADILQGTQAKISEVAGLVGYEDIKYFSQQFKKHTGQTPSEFRQSSKD
ncbi:response regulator [Paenibacillus doosanensis]|uniref:Response regulatory protein n=1 Tax=Paenibacillus konkukensis TaxID=2020716 RepID=A0ABY4RLV6_9BACL|nr:MULTISPECIES: response regulator [Paenibacillus]MCS7462171.1 response regulator [Paenibacillus doosanensis]UQZ83439.1 putative response regulatory protein [Paenibacillus konkukensis]